MMADGDNGGGGGFFSGLFGGGGGSKPSASPAAPTPTPQDSPYGGDSPPVSDGAKSSTPDLSTLDGFGAFVQEYREGRGTSTSQEPSFNPSELAKNEEFFNELASKADFSSAIPQELRQRIQNGEAAAMFEAMGIMSKAAYKQAMQHAATVSSFSLEATGKSFPASIEAAIDKALAARELSSAASEDAHPATAFMIESIANGIMQKSPGMSAREATGMARQLITQMGTSLQPKKPEPRDGQLPWDDWLKANS